MEKEALPVLEAMQNVNSAVFYGMPVHEGELYGNKTAVIICGVGKVNAGRGTQFAIEHFNCSAVVNIGVAGGLNGSLKIGEIYSIFRAVQYDFDLTQLNRTQIGTLDEFEENYIPLTPCSLYPEKSLGTGDRFNDSKKDYELLLSLGADIRDMELGAIAQVCVHSEIPCYSFKIISDLAGSGSTTEQYLENLRLCSEKLKKEIKNIAEAING